MYERSTQRNFLYPFFSSPRLVCDVYEDTVGLIFSLTVCSTDKIKIEYKIKLLLFININNIKY